MSEPGASSILPDLSIIKTTSCGLSFGLPVIDSVMSNCLHSVALSTAVLLIITSCPSAEPKEKIKENIIKNLMIPLLYNLWNSSWFLMDFLFKSYLS